MGKWASAGSYAKTMRMRPVPFSRRRRPPYKKGPQAPLRRGPLVRPAMRMRSGRSYTQTDTEKKRRYGKTQKTGENSSMSSHRFGFPMSAKLKLIYRQILGRNTVRNVRSATATSAQGTQDISVEGILVQSELAAIKTAILTAAGATDTNNAYKFFLGYMKYRRIIKNQSNHVVRLSIYDIVCNHTTVSPSIDNPVECWEKGLTDLGFVGNTERKIPGSSPFISPEFRRFMKVLKVTTINLEPGQQHEHNVYRKINRLVNTTEFDIATGLAFKGLSYFNMLSFNGSIGHESTVQANVTYMPARIDTVTHIEYNYGYLAGSKPTLSSTNNLPVGVVNFDFMGENQDADVDPIDS